MKFILLSDIHASSRNPVARKDFILNTFIRKFKFILEYARKIDAHILQAGDFFDQARDWRMLFVMMDLFEEEEPCNGIFTIPGQHDSYLRTKMKDNPTTAGALIKMGYIRMLRKKPKIIKDEDHKVYIYGAGWGEDIPKPKKKLGQVNILVVHAPISKAGLFPTHKYIGPDYFIGKHQYYNLILTGDTHRLFVKSTDKTTLVNTGPMIRREGDKYNMKHRPCFFVWDSKYFSLEKMQIPHEPSERVLTRIHIKEGEAETTEEDFEKFAVELLQGKHTVSRIKERIKTALENANIKVTRRTRNVINKAMEEADES